VYSTRNGFLNPAAWGCAASGAAGHPRSPMGMVSRAPWPLVPTAGGLAALAGDAAADPLAWPVDPAGGRQLMDLHGHTSRRVRWADVTSTRWGPGPASHGSRAVGQHVGLPDAAQAEGPQGAAVLGLGADGRAGLGDPQAAWSSRGVSAGAAMSAHLREQVGLALALAVGPQHAAGVTSSAGLPRRAAISSGRAALQPGDGGVGHVDAVGRASDLARMSRMPAISRMARAAPPAMTPVPGRPASA
jgi:hypothetical protein